ncbi:MAG TPA: hypothetical protein VE422_05520, partial [Terriglobia bacterium]|nr:hypothetical protein [Terriglobia bacterium]
MRKLFYGFSAPGRPSIEVALILLGGLLFVPETHAAVSFAQKNAVSFGSVSSASISFQAATTAGD